MSIEQQSCVEAMKLALEAAYLAGFNESYEGYNGEYPFGDKKQDPTENRNWKKARDNYVSQAIHAATQLKESEDSVLREQAQPSQRDIKQISLNISEKIIEQERPQNCGTGYCSCIECVMKPEKKELVQCWKCGDMDAEFHAKCNVPACGMKEQQSIEPYGWSITDSKELYLGKYAENDARVDAERIGESVAFPLYTSPPYVAICGSTTAPRQRQPLTDEEIKQVFGVGYVAKEFVEFVKAIEKAHGIYPSGSSKGEAT